MPGCVTTHSMEDAILICDAAALVDGGKGLRFPVTAGGNDATAFVVRYKGTVYAYLNRCAHVALELDWNHGEFFDSSGSYLMCSTHGAIYVPETGRCAGGPCRGGRLRSLGVLELDGRIFWQPDEYVRPARA
jgi:nitrite reductase/ring-hydroxylating ferredoxin subunit